jgi:hypothetical protein
VRKPEPVTLSAGPVRLVPMAREHAPGLEAAAADGQLWTVRVTSVPAPGEAAAYVDAALKGQADGHMLPFVVLDADGTVLGTTRYHDIVPAVDRLEIGYTWYAKRMQRTAVNTTCKLLLLTHAFDTLGASWWAGAPTTSTTAARRPSSGWAQRRMACCATTRCAATAPCATR